MNQPITAKINWSQQNGEQFNAGQYSRCHMWELESGTSIQASSSPHIVPIPHSNPLFIDPEEAFLCSLASCHMLFFLSIAAKKQVNILQYNDHPMAILAKNNANKVTITEVLLQPQVETQEEISPKILENIHDLAHTNCFIANSVHSKITIKPIFL